MTENSSSNPYSAPVDVADTAPLTDSQGIKQTTFANALLRWSPICVVSAIPSFFFGGLVTGWKVPGIIAMVLGIVVSIVVYATIDIQPFWRRWMSVPPIRQAIFAVFFTRMLISIIFPVGGINDMMFGMASTTFVNFLRMSAFNIDGGGNMEAIPAFVTTLIQGTLLSLEVFVVGLLFYGIIQLWRRFNSST